MAQLLLSEKMVAVYEIIGIIIMIVILIRQAKRKRENRDRRQVMKKQRWNEQLEERLRNPDYHPQSGRNSTPYDVQYRAEAQGAGLSGLQAEIEVQTKNSVRKFLFQLNREITIGRNPDNVLPLADGSVPGSCCSIFSRGSAAYLKCPDASGKVSVRRGRNTQQLKNQMVQLKNGDVLFIGKTKLLISLYDH